LPENWKKFTLVAKRAFAHKFSRNKFDENNKKIGYGVLTGEEDALVYVNHGVLRIEPGDILFIFTDGFENYLEYSEFINVFLKWDENIKYKIDKFANKKIKKFSREFDHERSLISVKIL
jgi:serine/threonine protein phosphatase PrpC